MVWLAYGAGLRAGELAGLRTEDVTLGGRPHLRVLGKGRRERLVPLAPQVAVVLAGWLHGRPQAGPLVCSQRDPNRPLQPRTVSALLGDVLKAAGVKASAHQLRHTFATELLAAGGGTNLDAVGRLLGHTDPKTTRRYTGAYDADAWAAVKLLPDPRRPGAATAE